jgi:para-nitrobenzyl esterase
MLILSLFIIGPARVSAASVDTGLINTTAGSVQGVIASTYRAFRGIPYAAPPTGDLRWQAPQPVIPWSTTRDATQLGSPCPQFAGVFVVPNKAHNSTNEDCLTLNVYTPHTTSSGQLPVMVWIHGGAFVTGASGDYDPTTLVASSNVIVVTLNYRLGVFGFLALSALDAQASDHVSGNYGLEDQQAALQWVKSNIAAFGGNSSNVTIFGDSSGGDSVCAHLISTVSAGLFQRAITQSGPCANPFLTQAAAEQTGNSIVASVGCASAADVAICMRAVPVSDLLTAASADVSIFTGSSFSPVVGGTLFPQQPLAALSAGSFNKVPVIEGTTRDEGRLFVALLENAQGAAISETQYESIVQSLAGSNATVVLAVYSSLRYGAPDLALSALITDSIFSCPARKSAQALAAWVPTYAYEFDDPTAPPEVTDPYMTQGAYHESDIQYIFQNSASHFAGYQQALSDQMIGYWTRFAATGHPNGASAPVWPTYSALTDQVFSLNPLASGNIATFYLDHNCVLFG